MTLKKKVCVLHTSFVLWEKINALFAKHMPDVTVVNIVEDQLLNDVIAHGGVTPAITRRMCDYARQAEIMNADCILNACSSVGETMDVARRTAAIPIVKIDEPMAEQAVQAGRKIAVFGTVETTLAPSCRLIERLAADQGKDVTVSPFLVDGAFTVLSVKKDVEGHNKMVLECIEKNHGEYDVVVLAQASMIVLAQHLQHLGKPVLYSMESGVLRVKQVLEQQ